VHSYHRDGTMWVDGNAGSATPYEPNTRGEWQEQPDFSEPPLSLDGAADHWQPGALFRPMTLAQQQALFENTARELANVSEPIRKRHIEHCNLADPAYSAGIAKALEALTLGAPLLSSLPDNRGFGQPRPA
jgi:catalase